jgi:hypothetical protein
MDVANQDSKVGGQDFQRKNNLIKGEKLCHFY